MDNSQIAIYSLVISAISLLITVIFNVINQYKISKDNEPQLTFFLIDRNNFLYLLVENSGKTKATNIKVVINKLYNNNNRNLDEDFIFTIPFELGPKEKIQGKIAINGEDITRNIFPYIDISVSYKKTHFKRKVSYRRQVFFLPKTDSKIAVETNLNIDSLKSNINNIHKSVLRLANYFDGCSIAPFDELNIVSEKHFQSDMIDIIKDVKNKNKNRTECIESQKKYYD